MDIHQVIEKLRTAPTPSRALDSMVATALGFRHFPKTKERDAYWISPDGEEVRIPRYTTSIDAAYKLAATLFPRTSGGASWDDKDGAASIGSAGYHVAANTPMAICIATLVKLSHGQDK